MANVINIQTLDELRRFLNEKGIMEIALRGKNKKFKTFQKIALDQLQQNEVSEKVQQAINILNKNIATFIEQARIKISNCSLHKASTAHNLSSPFKALLLLS